MEKAAPQAASAQNAVQQLQPCASCVGTASAGERSAGSAFDTSPRQLAQRRLIQSLQTPPVQLKTGTPISGAPSLQREAQSESPLSLEATPQPEAAAAQSSGEAGEHGGENLAEQVAQAEEAEKHAQESEADEPEATAETLDSPSEESLDEEDLTHATMGTAAPSTRGDEPPFQLVSRLPSNRIATYVQAGARRNRASRLARRREVIRFAPGRVRTVLVALATLGGGQGLICPPGSYVRRVNRFNYQGSRAADFAALGAAPPGYVWHHHHDFVSTGVNTGTSSMILLRIADHLPGHRGGVWKFNHTPGNTLAYV